MLYTVKAISDASFVGKHGEKIEGRKVVLEPERGYPAVVFLSNHRYGDIAIIPKMAVDATVGKNGKVLYFDVIQ